MADECHQAISSESAKHMDGNGIISMVACIWSHGITHGTSVRNCLFQLTTVGPYDQETQLQPGHFGAAHSKAIATSCHIIATSLPHVLMTAAHVTETLRDQTIPAKPFRCLLGQRFERPEVSRMKRGHGMARIVIVAPNLESAVRQGLQKLAISGRNCILHGSINVHRCPNTQSN